MKKATFLTVILMFALFGIAVAEGPSCGPRAHGHGKEQPDLPGGKWWKMPQRAQKLALTEDEKENLDTMYLQHRRQMIDLDAQVAKERLELEHLLESTEFDPDACMERFKAVQNAHSNLATERFKFLVQVRELIGVERFQQLKTEIRHHRMRGRHGGRHHGRGGMHAE